MSTMRVAVYSVRADVRTSARWHRHAAAEGFPSVGAWIAVAVERYLRARDRPVPLFWSAGRFTVALDCGEVEVSGAISPPFATFRGTVAGPKLTGLGVYTLVYLAPGSPGRILATVRYQREARTLAVDLSRTWIRECAPVGGNEKGGP